MDVCERCVCVCGGRKKWMMDIIRTRPKNWIGHILRGNYLQREIIEGTEERKRNS